MRTQVAAKRYASALYEEARVANNLSSVIEKLNNVAALVTNSEQFSVVVNSPVISKEDKVAVLTKLVETNVVDDFTGKFLVMLARKNRLDLLEQIINHLKELIMRDNNEATAEITSAVKLTDAELAEISSVLSSLTGKKISVNASVDDKILGGFVAKIGSTLYDASILGQLNKIRDRLIS